MRQPEATPGTTVSVVPANEAPWDDLQTVLARPAPIAQCQCQRLKTMDCYVRWADAGDHSHQLRAQTAAGHPGERPTSGLVAYLDGEPVGWCAVEPRTAYDRLVRARIVWAGRTEDKDDESVWAVTCFVTRVGFRRRGVSYALARAAVDFARERGARSLEGYPMITHIDSDEMRVGSLSVFAAAGLTEVTRPSNRRIVMRIDF